MRSDSDLLVDVRARVAGLDDSQAERLTGVSRHTIARLRREDVRLQVDTRRRLEAFLDGECPGDDLPEEIRADRCYPPEEAARLLGMQSDRAAKTLAECPDLPYVPMGPKGGIRVYHGRDLLRFIEERKVDPMRRAS